jgi:hypothetical protein
MALENVHGSRLDHPAKVLDLVDEPAAGQNWNSEPGTGTPSEPPWLQPSRLVVAGTYSTLCQ